MNLIIPVKISFRNLLASKLRSFLTILGVIIGVSAVIIIFSVGQSAQDLILKSVQGTGTNLIGVLPGKSDEKGPPTMAYGITVKSLTYDDLNVLRDKNQLSEVTAGAGYMMGTLTVSQEEIEEAASVWGVTASIVEVESLAIAHGRFFSEEEEKSLQKICVLGSEIAKDLFLDKDPLGQKVKIKNQKFTVIGVLKEKSAGGLSSAGSNKNIFVPLKTSQKLIYNSDYLNLIRLRVTDVNVISAVKEEIKKILRIRHNLKDETEDDFSVRDLATAVSMITTITNALRYFLLAVGSISLLVGGVGIMNIMLIAVNQRIREIGLRKALGAQNKDIRLQFLIESATVSLTGGILGILIGFLLSFVIYLVANLLKYDWPLMISFVSILIAVLVSVLVGIIFGMFPANKASKISPMEALRYE